MSTNDGKFTSLMQICIPGVRIIVVVVSMDLVNIYVVVRIDVSVAIWFVGCRSIIGIFVILVCWAHMCFGMGVFWIHSAIVVVYVSLNFVVCTISVLQT